MTKRKAGQAALFAAMFLAACQGFHLQPQSTAMDGHWVSSDGVYEAEFGGGRFASRFVESGKVVGEGKYTIAGATVTLRWPARDPKYSAVCTLTTTSSIQCVQDGVQSEWKRA